MISGDLTQRARPEQFRAARRFVESIPCPTVAVPGNHDVPLYRFWERALYPFGAWRRHFGRELEPVVRDEEVLLLGLNTAFSWTFTGGRLTRRQLRRMRREFSQAPDDCYKIAVLHHNLLRPRDLVDAPRRLRGAEAALRALVDAGVDMVLGGHMHQSLITPLVADSADGGVALYTGTATSSRGRGPEAGSNTCHWIEIHDAEARVSLLRWEAAGGAFVETQELSFPRRAGDVAG